jgi:hypothetical protein
MEIREEWYWRITDENTLTVSGRRKINGKELCGIIKIALKRCGGNNRGIEALFFGDNDPIENKPKLSSHYHIAFLCEMTKKERTEISQTIKFFSSRIGLGSKDIIEEWIVNHSMGYLLNHGKPFYRKF